MTRKMRFLPLIIVLSISMICISCAHAKPPKPGPDFVWVKAHKTPAGKPVSGHWKYVGPVVTGKTWVSGHYDASGDWVEGHWKPLEPPKKDATWVPGHYGPRGKWIPGHWR